jgi:hypothetical protein
MYAMDAALQHGPPTTCIGGVCTPVGANAGDMIRAWCGLAAQHVWQLTPVPRPVLQQPMLCASLVLLCRWSLGLSGTGWLPLVGVFV